MAQGARCVLGNCGEIEQHGGALASEKAVDKELGLEGFLRVVVRVESDVGDWRLSHGIYGQGQR